MKQLQVLLNIRRCLTMGKHKNVKKSIVVQMFFFAQYLSHYLPISISFPALRYEWFNSTIS